VAHAALGGAQTSHNEDATDAAKGAQCGFIQTNNTLTKAFLTPTLGYLQRKTWLFSQKEGRIFF
jgi:hypothetical protein